MDFYLNFPCFFYCHGSVHVKYFCCCAFVFISFLHAGVQNKTTVFPDTLSSQQYNTEGPKYILKPEDKCARYEIHYSFNTTWNIITSPEFSEVPVVRKIIEMWNTTRHPKIVQKKPRKRKVNATTTIKPSAASNETELPEATPLPITTLRYETTTQKLTGSRYPFVLVEGTLTTARRRLLRGLIKHTTFVYVRNFRQHPFKYRDKFSAHSLLKLRRAYVTLQFYLTGRDVERILQDRPVIMSGFWMRQAAEFLARKYSDLRKLPPAGDMCYKWPFDLVRPDLVFFLHTPRTDKHVGEDTHKRLERTIEIYHRMDPSVIDVDQSYNNATEKQYSQLRKLMIDKLVPKFSHVQECIKYKLPADKLRRKGFRKNKTLKARKEFKDVTNVTLHTEPTEDKV